MKKIVHILLLTAILWLTTQSLWAANRSYNGPDDGNWNVAANWLPIGVPSTLDNVTISGRRVVLDVASVTINSLTLNGGATLSGTNALAITGNAMINLGVISIDADITISGNLTMDGAVMGSSSASSVTNCTVTGFTAFIITISGFDNAILKKKLVMNGGGSWSQSGRIIVRDGSIFEIPLNQTFTFNQGSTNFEDFDTAGNSVEVKGTLRKLGTGGLRMSSTSLGFITLNNTGSILIDAGEFGINSPYSGNGSIAVASGATLTPSTSGLNYQNATFTNNGTILTNTLTFNGSTAQTLSGNGSIAKLTINNANGLSISGTQTITTALTLTNGNIQLSANDLSIGSSTLTGGSASSYIKTNSTGNLKRSVGTSPVLFPVGESNYTPVTINQTSGTDVYAVRVSDGIDIAHQLLGTQFVAKEWDISRTPSNMTAATVKMEWNAGEEGVGFSCATAQMLHHNGTTWQALPLSGTTTSCATSPRSITKTGVTSFSPFAIGLPAFVLSAELIDFKAISHKSTIDLWWQTAAESDLSHFEIEQSADGLNFSKIGESKAAGKPNSYLFTPKRPLSILTYFRLKIVNSDGRFSYSKILSVAFGKDLTVKAFPNPVQNELTIDVFSESKYLEIGVVDVLGRSVFQKKEENTDGPKLLTINALDWVSGIYFLKVSDGKNVFQQKIVKR